MIKDKSCLILLLIFLFLFSALIFLCNYSSSNAQKLTAQTETVEESLTATHRDEVIQVITNLETKFGGKEGIYHPNEVLPDIMIGSELTRLIKNREKYSGYPEVQIIVRVDFTGLRVIEYTDTSLIAIACLTETYNTIDGSGNVIDEGNYGAQETLYFFRRDQGVWKAVYFPDVTVLHWAIRDWDYYTSDDLHTLTDDFSGLAMKECIDLK